MVNGVHLNMCIKCSINQKNPLSLLHNDPYSFEILRKNIDFNVEIVTSDETANYLLFRRRYNGIVGYVAIFERVTITLELFKEIYLLYKKFVLEYSNSNFRDFELILIAEKIDPAALSFVREYNKKYTHRCPISIIINEHRSTETESEV